MAETDNQKIRELEALLFYYGGSLSLKKIGALLDLSSEEAKGLIEHFSGVLESDASRGIMLIHHNDSVELVTKPEVKGMIQKLVEEEFSETLSPAALETLSIIAYMGPMPRATIDYIRGVNSSFIVRNLLMRGLIERSHNKEKGNVYDYQITPDFLKHMALPNIESLPHYEDYKDIMKKVEEATRAAQAASSEKPSELTSS